MNGTQSQWQQYQNAKWREQRRNADSVASSGRLKLHGKELSAFRRLFPGNKQARREAVGAGAKNISPVQTASRTRWLPRFDHWRFHAAMSWLLA
jgi:hypothetical protein